MRNTIKLDFVTVLVVMIMLAIFAGATPINPDSLSVGSSTRRANPSAASVEAQAGNVTALTINGTSVTMFWQGYYGNISGSVVLANSGGNNLYEWELASPTGEIYATRNSSINWSNIACANQSQIFDEDSFLGANSTSNADSVNRTFYRTDHPSFYTGLLNFTSGACKSASINGTGTGSNFHEVLLAEFNETSGGAKFIYTSVIDADTTGFDDTQHDFQMIVGEPGSGSELYPSGGTTTYYFYVELQ
ncbi:hypothetical protein J4475_03875 [Candidatus Woesearchaeota archaeon]|nr:hypothetical protein [Candidatus Woesearchaeota archaeon]